MHRESCEWRGKNKTKTESELLSSPVFIIILIPDLSWSLVDPRHDQPPFRVSPGPEEAPFCQEVVFVK
jgi:hypothetical protein